MKNTKLMLLVAFVCTMLSFGAVTANAQTTVPVTVTSLSGSDPSFASQVTYYVTLHNNTTNDDYYFQTTPYNLSDDGSYHIGSIPTGDYSVSISFSHYNYWQSYFDWNVNGYDGYSLSMYSGTDYTLKSSVTVNDNYPMGDYGLAITMYRI